MIFRLLPFLIIVLTSAIGSKVLEIVDHAPLFVKEIKAAESKEKKEPKEDVSTKKDSDAEESVSEEVKRMSNKINGVVEPSQQDDRGPEFSDTELEILQSLSARRDYLEQREHDISLKEASLLVIEKNIDLKIAELQELQKELESILAAYEQKEDEKVQSLVKIYESMKPQDSAKIFEQLQMSILVEVADQMKEPKLGAILAKMDTYKAKELTVELANRRRIMDSK